MVEFQLDLCFSGFGKDTAVFSECEALSLGCWLFDLLISKRCYTAPGLRTELINKAFVESSTNGTFEIQCSAGCFCTGFDAKSSILRGFSDLIQFGNVNTGFPVWKAAVC